MIGFGWRWMFVTMGLVGVPVAAAWLLLYRDAAEGHFTDQERHYLTDGEEARTDTPVQLSEWLSLFRLQDHLGVGDWLLRRGVYGLAVSGVAARLSGDAAAHVDSGRQASSRRYSFAFGVLGSIGGGWIANWLMQRRVLPGEQPQDADNYRFARHGGLHCGWS